MQICIGAVCILCCIGYITSYSGNCRRPTGEGIGILTRSRPCRRCTIIGGHSAVNYASIRLQNCTIPIFPSDGIVGISFVIQVDNQTAVCRNGCHHRNRAIRHTIIVSIACVRLRQRRQCNFSIRCARFGFRLRGSCGILARSVHLVVIYHIDCRGIDAICSFLHILRRHSECVGLLRCSKCTSPVDPIIIGRKCCVDGNRFAVIIRAGSGLRNRCDTCAFNQRHGILVSGVVIVDLIGAIADHDSHLFRRRGETIIGIDFTCDRRTIQCRFRNRILERISRTICIHQMMINCVRVLITVIVQIDYSTIFGKCDCGC